MLKKLRRFNFLNFLNTSQMLRGLIKMVLEVPLKVLLFYYRFLAVEMNNKNPLRNIPKARRDF